MKRRVTFMLSILFACMLTGCSVNKPVKEKGDYYLYYTNIEETGLQKEIYDAAATSAEELIPELLGALERVPRESSYMNLLTEDLKIENYEYEDHTVKLNMSESYGTLSKTKEVLVRAGLVRTLVQIDDVEYVTISVAGEPLTDSTGAEIGPLNEDSFVENSGKEINSYMSSTLTLYFSGAEGSSLMAESRKLYYSSNVPIERVVVEQIVKGPREEGHMATVASDTKVLGVTVVEDICYVNLSREFSEHTMNVQQEIPIYSIVNSLTANCDVKKVQISVEGESNFVFRENMDLNRSYERNADLIQLQQ